MSSSLQFSPETQRLADFMGVDLSEQGQGNAREEALKKIFDEAVASPRLQNGASLSPSISEFPGPSEPRNSDVDELLAEIDSLLASEPAFVFPAPELDPPVVQAKPIPTPQSKPRPKLIAPIAESSASLRNRAADLSFPLLATKPVSSREMPRLNPFADDVLSIGPGPHSTLHARLLSQALCGIDNLDTYSVFGSQPKPTKLPVAPTLSHIPQAFDLLDAPFHPDQANYYFHLMAATPSTSGLDRLSAVIGSDIYIRNNNTGKIQVLAMIDGDETFSYAVRELYPTAVAFTPSGRHLIVGTKEGRVELWTLPEKGNPSISISLNLPDEDTVNAVGFANGRILAGTHSGKIYEINPKTGETVQVLELGNDDVCSLCVSPDGKTVAIGVDVKTADRGVVSKLFLLSPAYPNKPEKSRFKLVETPFESVKASFKIAFSPDGKMIALATGRYQGRLIFLKVGKETCTEVPVDTIHKPKQARFDDKGRYIFKVFGKTEDGRVIGHQASGIQWLKQEKGDLIIATLETGEIVFLPLDPKTLRIGKPLIQQIHDTSNTNNEHQNGRPYFNAYRNGILYTAAPLEPVPGDSNSSGVIRMTAVLPAKKESGSSLLSAFTIR